MKKLSILYAGDSWEGGPANYLLGILRTLQADFLHVPSSVRMDSKILEKHFDGIILSDYARSLLSHECEEKIMKKVLENGTGLLMVGGWASFSGPFGGWRGSLVEGLLPVICQERDDRMNLPGGALIQVKNAHPLFDSFSFENSPVLCGLNEVIPRKDSKIILNAKKITQTLSQGNLTLALDAKEYPLFVIEDTAKKRSAALTTDVAPHWCGGFVDWGNQSQKVTINPKIAIEVGNLYVEFLSRIIRWIARA